MPERGPLSSFLAPGAEGQRGRAEYQVQVGVGTGLQGPETWKELEKAGEVLLSLGHSVLLPSPSRSDCSWGAPRRGPRIPSQRSHLVWGHPVGSHCVV